MWRPVVGLFPSSMGIHIGLNVAKISLDIDLTSKLGPLSPWLASKVSYQPNN
jgi:hypothetical protein